MMKSGRSKTPMSVQSILAGAGCGGILLGVILGTITPTTMKPAPESEWRKHAMAINAAAPYPGYASRPEQVYPRTGYVNPAHYQDYYDYYIEPVQTAYIDRVVPEYAPERVIEAPAEKIPALREIETDNAELKQLNARWDGSAPQQADAGGDPEAGNLEDAAVASAPPAPEY